MNKERILELADVIERHAIPDLGFNMVTYGSRADTPLYQDIDGHSCGTVGCIAGWAYVYFGGKDLHDLVRSHHVSGIAAHHLGLDWEQEHDLFRPEGYSEAPEMYPPAKAVAVLRNLAETGTVNWEL
jgi:hypothetical protein